MKGIYIILIISILFLNSLEFDNKISNESYSSDYSLLVDKVRKDAIDDILLNLPKRESTDLLKMLIEMSKIKEKFYLNDPESAYLVYKWIALNIEVDCINPKLNYESPSTVFNAGKSGSMGIAALFKNMCSFMKVESNIISGHTKIKVASIEEGEIIKEIENDWNSILIDDNYYLIDTTMGAGECFTDYFEKTFSDLYFGTKPEIFIRWHFPEDNKWQLLSENITTKEFSSMAYLTSDFYKEGFKNIEPDSFNMTIKEDSKIILTYDESITNLSLYYVIIKLENGEYSGSIYNDLTISKGKVEIKLDLLDKDSALLGILNQISERKVSIIAALNINFPKNENTLSKRFFLGKKKNHIRNNKPINYSFIKNNIFNYKRKDS